MNKATETAILDYFGETSLNDLFENHEFLSAMNDCVQPSFCKACGEAGQDLEPDARGGECEYCGKKAVASIGVIILGF
jgi:hypothetical protein